MSKIFDELVEFVEEHKADKKEVIDCKAKIEDLKEELKAYYAVCKDANGQMLNCCYTCSHWTRGNELARYCWTRKNGKMGVNWPCNLWEAKQ